MIQPEHDGLGPGGPGEETAELFGGRLKIIQKVKGYRFSVDALLLAGFVRGRPGGYLADLGTGSGVVALSLARKGLFKGVVGVEYQEELADMARRSVTLNKLAAVVSILHGDIREINTLLSPESFDVVTFNPPYRPRGTGRVNPQGQKAIARHEIEATIADFLRAARFLLKQGGLAYAIYPASRLVGLLCAMRGHDLEPKRMRMVHSRRQTAAQFVLVEGVKRGREEVEIDPPLIIYREDNSYTEGMKEFLHGLGEG